MCCQFGGRRLAESARGTVDSFLVRRFFHLTRPQPPLRSRLPRAGSAYTYVGAPAAWARAAFTFMLPFGLLSMCNF